MIKHFSDEQTSRINAILTAANILEETVQKHAPKLKDGVVEPEARIHGFIKEVVARIMKIEDTCMMCGFDD